MDSSRIHDIPEWFLWDNEDFLRIPKDPYGFLKNPSEFIRNLKESEQMSDNPE
jgi:hypothetical protein